MPTGTCEWCGSYRNWLHKHHVKLQCEGGTDADGIKYLCANCHEDMHGGPMGGESVAHRRHTPEINARRAEAMRQRWQDPEWAAEMRAKRKNQPKALQTAEARAEAAERMRRRWADPDDAIHGAHRRANEKRSATMKRRVAERSEEAEMERRRKISATKRAQKPATAP